MKDQQVERVARINPAALLGGALVVAVLGRLVWHHRGPLEWERPIISVLRHAHLPGALHLILLWQPVPFAFLTLALAGVALMLKRPRLALWGSVGCLAAMVLNESVLKTLIGRHLHSSTAVFPSGHVAAAAAWAMFAWLVFDRSRLRSALVAVPLLVGWAVVSAGDHYPADAIAGMLVGGIVVYLVVRIALGAWTAPALAPTTGRDATVGAGRGSAGSRLDR